MTATDAEIIEAAFEERVKELFKIVADACYTGEPEAAAISRFRRGLVSARRVRDLALEAAKDLG